MGAWIACTFARADLAALPGDAARVGALVLARAARRGTDNWGRVFLPCSTIAAATGLRLRCQIERAIAKLQSVPTHSPEPAMAMAA